MDGWQRRCVPSVSFHVCWSYLVQHKSLVKNDTSMDTAQIDLKKNASIFTNNSWLFEQSFLSIKMMFFLYKRKSDVGEWSYQLSPYWSLVHLPGPYYETLYLYSSTMSTGGAAYLDFPYPRNTVHHPSRHRLYGAPTPIATSSLSMAVSGLYLSRQ